MLKLADIIRAAGEVRPVQDALLATSIRAAAPLDKASEGDLSFLSSAKYRRDLAATAASAVFLTEKEMEHCPEGTIPLVVADPYLAYARVSHLFDQRPELTSVHPSAAIDPSATLGDGVVIGANAVVCAGVQLAEGVEVGHGCVVEDNTSIGARTVLRPNVTIQHDCVIGADCVFQSGVVIGGSGFGYAPNQGRWQGIAQLGRVVIGDRVEIGANSTIDRGAIEDTVIADDVIIDNLVQLGHNVRIDQGVAMASQVGISGSTHVGAGCTIGGQAGFAGHLEIAAGSHFTGRAMVTKGTKEAGLYSSGLPATTNREWRKQIARIRQLESLQSRLQALEKQLSGETGE